MDALPAKLQSAIERELDEGETIRWSSRPQSAVLWRELRASALPFAYLFSAFAGLIVLASVVAPMGEPGLESERASFYGMAGFCVAIAMCGVIGSIFYARYTAATTAYAITNRRVIILQRTLRGVVTERDYRADELIHFARREYPDGAGTLTIESARGAGTSAQVSARHKLRAIEGVVEVERMLRAQFGGA